MEISLGGFANIQITTGILLWIVFAVFYFRFTQGLGKSIFSIFNFVYLATFLYDPLLSFIIIGVGIIYLGSKQIIQCVSKPNYVSAHAKFEGGGIRRGLSPPEIEAILGKPLQRILTIILIGLLEKGFVTVRGVYLLEFHVSDPMRTRDQSLNHQKRSQLRRDGAQKLKQILFPFEEPFLELFEQEEGKEISEIDLGVTIKPFFQWVADRVGGYDLQGSRNYYQEMVQKFVVEKDNNYRGIDWQLLNQGFENSSGADLAYHPAWFVIPSDESQTDLTLMKWFVSLEESIKSRLSKDDFEIRLGKGLNEISTDVMKEIVQSTYHS